MKDILRIKSITQFHEIIGIAPPMHPLISVIDDKEALSKTMERDEVFEIRFTTDMYKIMFKDKINASVGYGRNSYDFQEGTMVFAAPGQVFTTPKKEDVKKKEGWTLLVHPDLLLKSELGSNMDDYRFFSYEVTEALHLSEKERVFIFQLVEQLQVEYSMNQDKHSQELIISNLQLLLNYCLRYYDRQFYTRSNINKDLLSIFEKKLKAYFKSDLLLKLGTPTAAYFGEAMQMSPNYLSDLLKKESGLGVKEHIDAYIIKQAKTILLNSKKTVGEIAFDLGFEYPQSFTRLFKKKTGQSPSAFRSLS